MKRIAIDMDEVIADSHGSLLRIYESEFGKRILPEEVQGRSWEELVGEDHAAHIRRYPSREGFFRALEPIADSQQVLKALMEHYEVFIVSAATEFPLSPNEKLAWLAEYFPFISWRNVVLCGDKSIIAADYLIDDHLKNLRTFTGTPLLFSAPHNLRVTGYERLHSWQDVAARFL
ncbi:5'(3')-deoxyribonucleotidase [Catalinimonas alkaloidigena]|uniref:5'(3')-deoxyribonucleotidase n=1 Tax=Catalinimonas alkaloidigena TaxID=1075417 RepID=A0A1G9DDW9_9BACT|nr:hypothetical protein [Catalinimonas alkaloidigena]SDK62014.1 5'(3')-deoxyribonucleotidase [Catalinimonas alkaloidigena]